MKRFLGCLLAGILLCTTAVSAATVEGVSVDSALLSGVTMAPITGLSEALSLSLSADAGHYVLTDPADPALRLEFDTAAPDGAKERFYHYNEDGSLTIDGEEETELPHPICRYGEQSELYVPFRYVCEYFGARVYWSEETGASAERSGYGKTTLMRADGTHRERVAMPDGLESAQIEGNTLLYIVGEAMYKKDLVTGSTAYLCPAGKAHVENGKVFVAKGDGLYVTEIESGKTRTVVTGATVYDYMAGGYIWAESADGITIYNTEGDRVDRITGTFDTPIEYVGGRVYYLTETEELRRAWADGSGDEFLAKAAFYPEYIDGFVYYTDLAGNYRRVNVESKADEMVYGLNLEYIAAIGDDYVLNLYDEGGKHRMFIGAPDGRGLLPFGAPGVVLCPDPVVIGEALIGVSLSDGRPYRVEKDGAAPLSNDVAALLCGYYDGYVYYLIN